MKARRKDRASERERERENAGGRRDSTRHTGEARRYATERKTVNRARARDAVPTRYWRRGVVVSGVRRMNEVNARRARLVPGWVTVFGRVYHFGM